MSLKVAPPLWLPHETRVSKVITGAIAHGPVILAAKSSTVSIASWVRVVKPPFPPSWGQPGENLLPLHLQWRPCSWMNVTLPLQAPRHGGRNLPPPMGGSRQSTAANRHQGRDRPAPRVAALGPRDAGIQKVRGRAPPPYDRAPRYGPPRAMPPVMSRGQTRNGPQAGHRPGPGREFDEGPHRAGPSWDRKPAPLRPGPVPARLPPPMGRRAPLPERGPLLGRGPRDDFGASQRMVNPRAPIRGAGPDRDAAGSGFPVGRRAGPSGARQPGAGPAHTAPRTAPPRGRVPPPAARRDSHPPLVAQRPHEPPAAPLPAERQPARYDEQPRFSGAAPDQQGVRGPHPSGGMGHRPNPAGSR